MQHGLRQKSAVFATIAGKCALKAWFLQHGRCRNRHELASKACHPPLPLLCCKGTPPPSSMPLVVSKSSNWQINSFVKIPFALIVCDDLTPNSRLLLMFLFNQIGYKPVSSSTIDRCLGMHRSTRNRCMVELKELGFIGGSDAHIVLSDPQPILAKLKERRKESLEQVAVIIGRDEYLELLTEQQRQKQVKAEEAEKRDFLKEASDSWNRYRPKDYQRIRRISAPILKAIDIHMRDLSIVPHAYDEFFSAIKAGIDKSDFWSNQNTSKTLQSITGVGSPTDKKRSNVYSLFNEGISSPAQPIEEEQREDTIVYPARYRKLINDYDAAQHSYNEAYRENRVDTAVENYVIRTESALVEAGLKPELFRLKYGMKTWPTDTPEPAESRVVNWEFDDEYGYVY